MPMILRMGVIDIPYSHDRGDQSKRRSALRGDLREHLKKAARPDGEPQNKTTGDVATMLEAKYHIMENFAHRYRPVIVKEVENVLAGQLKNRILGQPTNQPISFAQAGSVIEHHFRAFLDNREMDGMPGVPTAAAERGVSHRFKHPYKKRAPRPSFIDTGTYQASYVAEIIQNEAV